jgi:phosphoglucomutase
LNATFTESHILAITQAICDYRRNQGITGPLFMGKDTDALSRPAERVALEVLAANSPDAVTATEFAGEPITAKLTRAPGNDATIGGLKVVSISGWFAARPSGTEHIYKLYAESLKSADHLAAIVEQAQEIVGRAIGRK